MKRKLLALFLTLCLVLPLFPAVTLAEDEVVATYELVTEAPEDWSGRYLIVYTKGDQYLAMNSALDRLDAVNNYIDVSSGHDGRRITVSKAMDVFFTIAKNDDGYSIVSQSGKYLNQPNNTNGLPDLKEHGDPLNISVTSDNNAIIEAGSGAVLCFNAASNQMRFRFYKTDSYNNQQPIYLYRLKDGNTTPEPTEEPTPTPEATPTPEVTTKTYTLIKSTDNLTDGTYLIVGYKDSDAYAMGYQKNNNRSAVIITIDEENKVVLTSDKIASDARDEKNVYEFTVSRQTDDAGKDVFTFFDAVVNGYLYAASSSSNHLKSQATLSDKGRFSITADNDGGFLIQAKDTSVRNMLRFNSGNNPPIFACYASGQDPVYLYKLVEPETPTEKPKFGNCSVVLSGQIGMNFYMNLPDAYTGGTMEFTVGNRTATAAGVKQDDGRYKFTCYLTSVEMAEQITAVYTYEIDGVPESVNKTISVQGYLDKMITNADNNPEFAKASALAKALWNYGYYAQLAVADGKNHSQMTADYVGDANLPSSISGFDVTASLDNTMIVSATYSLTLDTETALNIYLTPAEGITLTKKNVSVAATGAYVEYAVEPVGSRYRIRITGIAAHELGTKITITAGTSTVTASALSYVQKCLANENAKPEAKNAAAALYRYYQETIQYMEEVGQ